MRKSQRRRILLGVLHHEECRCSALAGVGQSVLNIDGVTPRLSVAELPFYARRSDQYLSTQDGEVFTGASFMSF